MPRRLNPSLLVGLIVVVVVVSRFYERPEGRFESGSRVDISGAVRVGDGDSLEIGQTRIRLHGIDAVELAQHCKDGLGRDYSCGEEAARTLQDLVRGRTVRCDERHGIDQYGRVTAVCTADGLDINAAMVESGFALAYRQHSLAYVANEERAKAARRGLWAGSFEMPWDYRRD
jgi:endonuclease YncB( thermonuclease family)